jgi:SAM-dependent methyltransferase
VSGSGAVSRWPRWPPSWRDDADRPAPDVPALPGPDDDPFYVAIGDFQGEDYRRNAFAAGTDEEVAALRRLVDLPEGTRLLDVGCGDARHLRALAADGVAGTGVDVSPGLIAAGRRAATDAGVDLDLRVGDARSLADVLGDDLGRFDVVWSLCQGALGTSPASDPDVVRGMATAVRPGGAVVVTCFHALFAARHLAPGDAFDPVHLVHHQTSDVHGPDHTRARFELWTASYTVPGAVRLLEDAGLQVTDVRGVEPGAYGRRGAGEVALDDPELLLVARRPAAGATG